MQKEEYNAIYEAHPDALRNLCHALHEEQLRQGLSQGITSLRLNVSYGDGRIIWTTAFFRFVWDSSNHTLRSTCLNRRQMDVRTSDTVKKIFYRFDEEVGLL